MISEQIPISSLENETLTTLIRASEGIVGQNYGEMITIVQI
jgi:hypothetical protein